MLQSPSFTGTYQGEGARDYGGEREGQRDPNVQLNSSDQFNSKDRSVLLLTKEIKNIITIFIIHTYM